MRSISFDDLGFEMRCPRRWTAQRTVAVDGRTFQHAFLFPIGLETVVGPRPDALFLADLALSLVRAAAWPVALVLRALRFGTQVGDLGERAVAAIATVECQHLQHMLGPVQRPRQARRVCGDLVKLLSGDESSGAFLEDSFVKHPVELVGQRRTLRILLRP